MTQTTSSTPCDISVPDKTGARAQASSASIAVCPVCPHHCQLAPGQRGRCRARRNVGGAVVAESYGRVTSLALDPIEKKPLARYRPGSFVVSVGSYGCNLRCPFCQNYEISQAGPDDTPWRAIEPDELVRCALEARARDARVQGIAYTYNEPLVTWEYVRDCAELAHKNGLINVLVSNGCVEPMVLDALDGLIDAANIDLKGFTAAWYETCGAGPRAFDCVTGTIERLAQNAACHLEVTTLVIPNMNDTDAEIDEAARWLAGLDNGAGRSTITYHLTRFFPRWRLTDRPATPVSTVYHLADVARRHLTHVYTGNC